MNRSGVRQILHFGTPLSLLAPILFPVEMDGGAAHELQVLKLFDQHLLTHTSLLHARHLRRGE